jgi:hypothetical protein
VVALPTRGQLAAAIPAFKARARGQAGLSDDELLVALIAADLLH